MLDIGRCPLCPDPYIRGRAKLREPVSCVDLLCACWSISVEHSARSSQEPQSDSYNFYVLS